MKEVYLDNAATTALDPEVLEEMLPYLKNHFGNPSSIHRFGRPVKAAIEQARKKIAEMFNTSPSEIFFTSGGTEADNTALWGLVQSADIEQLISSPLEHHAVLHTLESISKYKNVPLNFIEHNSKGGLNLAHLEELLKNNPKTLVSLMHINNELGNINPIQEIAEISKEYQAYFHSDTVQSIGHFRHNLQENPVDFIVGAAHKFHGPKGVGFLYAKAENKIPPFIVGGSQERNMRGGTENVIGIMGMAKALEIAYQDLENHTKHLRQIKEYTLSQLKNILPEIQFNGLSGDLAKSTYTVINVSFPPSENSDMLLLNLDINGIAASGGSACSSGSSIGSHVLQALNTPLERTSIRFSFSKYTQKEEIDFLVQKIKEAYQIQTAVS